ncbi:MAG TPA: hypothetical protein P5513_07605 [Candidatus Diapherotrites archaeon]|jgi:predicted protein tyrosine phosphatase|nr:hypothetical protein [Candidatus Diapherotrites archaeon]
MEIKVYSQYDFEQMCKNKHLNDSNVEFTKDAYICVRNNSETNSFFKENHPNVLNLFFDDCTPKEVKMIKNNNLVLFNEKMANELKLFFDLNKDAKVWHVHCLEGISRSGAIALWLANNLGLNAYSLVRSFSLEPNMYVLELLRKE